MTRLAGYLLGMLLVCVMTVSSATAQEEAQPLIQVDLPETEVIPGQPLVLRITVLVPTWLPKPVVFPNFEAPDLMVKLLERSTNPTSQTIKGETWSGVTRAYRLSPMVPGPIAIPAQELVVTWAEPGKTDPLVSTVALEPFTIVGVVPPGAEDLDPFIAAAGLRLTEELSSDSRVLKPGDSLTRTITVDVSGTSPLFLPRLLPPHQIDGVASYPSEPLVTERADRTWLSGTRAESTTLVGESGGSGTAPEIELRWFNLETEEIETASVPGFELLVDGPVARDRPEIDLRIAAALAIAGGLALYLLFRLGRYALPKLTAWRDARRQAHEATESWAFARVKHAISKRDYSRLAAALAIWRKRMPAPEAVTVELRPHVTALGESLYGVSSHNNENAWSELSKALAKARATQLQAAKRDQTRPALAPLNPS